MPTPAPRPADRTPLLRRILPSSLAWLAGLACVGCCAVPFLIGAGVLGGTGWAAFGSWLPGITVVLAVLAAGTWWWTARRRHAAGCAGGSCGCSAGDAATTPESATGPESQPARKGAGTVPV